MIRALLLLTTTAAVAAPTAESLKFFEKEVRPLLVEACYDAAEEWERTHGVPEANPHGAKLLDAEDMLDRARRWNSLPSVGQ